MVGLGGRGAQKPGTDPGTKPGVGTDPGTKPGTDQPPRREADASRESQRRIDRLALQCEDAEDALVHAVEGLFGDEPFQGLDAERELPQRE